MMKQKMMLLARIVTKQKMMKQNMMNLKKMIVTGQAIIPQLTEKIPMVVILVVIRVPAEMIHIETMNRSMSQT
jgi:hypothetical protein